MRLTFNELAERELNEAAQYYEHEQGGLGTSFLLEARRCIDAIVSHPQAGALIAGSIRRRLFRRFPYALLYTASSDEVRVLAVMNLHRRPGYWVGREP